MRTELTEEDKKAAGGTLPGGARSARDVLAFSTALRRRGKKVGSVVLGDELGLAWKVKVRLSGKRGRYVVAEPVERPGPPIRASADAFRPDKYLALEPAGWELLARLAAHRADWRRQVDDAEGLRLAREHLTRLVRAAREGQRRAAGAAAPA